MLRVTFTVCLVVCCLTVARLDAGALSGSKPNIILVMTDDQGYGPLHCHGNTWLHTPNLDKLHDTSTRFERFLVSPTCSPTRSAIMTGRHPLKNGVTHTILERERMALEATILPQVLKTVGYQTAMFGKWHLGDEDPYQPYNRGFDEAFHHGAGGIGQAYNCSCADAPGNKYFDPVIRHNGEFVKTHGFCTDVFFDAALGWIHKVKDDDKPFFVYLATNAPHGPYNAPEKNAERFTKLGFDKNNAGFYGMVENIDENIGRFMAKMDEWGLYKNTVIIFMSDNGTATGGFSKGDKPLGHLPDGTPMLANNDEMNGHKGSPHEGGVRVPFFVRWDGKFQPGRDIDRIAAHIDILPTLADLAGAKIPENQVEGRSLLPLLEDAKADWPDRTLYTQVARWKTGSEPNDFEWKKFGVRNQRFRFVEGELFDMTADPSETTDVASAHPDQVTQLHDAYDRFWKEARPLMVNETAPMSKTKPFHEAYYKQLKDTGIPDWEPPKY
ncbi:MAG: sulfatase-like hydrolase/transferase [Phycisphaera sp.]|nr:sulfatase-like hydrolase/transferase [Phycisphaera sp.]